MAAAIKISEEAYHPQINNDADALVEDSVNDGGTALEDDEATITAINPLEKAIFTTLYNNRKKDGYWDALPYEQLKKIASILNVGAFTAMFHQWIASDKKKQMVWHISKTHNLIGYARRKINNIEKKEHTNSMVEHIDSGTWGNISGDLSQLRILATDTKLSWRQELIDYSNDDDKNNGFWTTKKCRAIQKWAYDCFTHPERLQKYNEFNNEIELYNRSVNGKMIATDVFFAFTIFTNYDKHYEEEVYTNLKGKISHYKTEAPVDWKDEVKMAIINKFGKKDHKYTVLIEVTNVIVRDEKFAGYESDKGVEHLHFDFCGEDDSYKQIRPVKKPEEPAAEPDIY